MNEGIGFNDIVEMLIKNNPNKKPDFLRDELIAGILSGEIDMADNNSLNDFYRWCKNYLDEDKDSTSPLNWINLFLNSTIAGQMKDMKLPGLKPMLQVIKETKVGQEFDFALHPSFLKKSFLKKLQEDKSSFLALRGTLRCKKDEFYFLLKNDYKIMMKFCWVITKGIEQ